MSSIIDKNRSVYILGDLHLSANQEWRPAVGDAFLDWFEFEFEVEPDSIFICLGDLMDDASNVGGVLDQLERFRKILLDKFTHSFLMVGNHDLKLFKGKPHLSFSFLSGDRITILREPAEILHISGLKFLSLPHYNYRVDLPPMNLYYSNLPQNILDQEYDVVLGHFADNSSDKIYAHQINLNPIKTNLVCLGDIHSRWNDHYTGSAYACKISEHETLLPRAIWKIKKTDVGVSKEELELPVFCGYYFVEYPKPLPETDAKVSVWTVLGVETKSIAEQAYPGVFIRSVSMVKKVRNSQLALSSDDFYAENIADVFTEYLKTRETPISRQTLKIVRELIVPPTPVVQTN